MIKTMGPRGTSNCSAQLILRLALFRKFVLGYVLFRLLLPKQQIQIQILLFKVSVTNEKR